MLYKGKHRLKNALNTVHTNLSRRYHCACVRNNAYNIKVEIGNYPILGSLLLLVCTLFIDHNKYTMARCDTKMLRKVATTQW